MHKRLVDPCGLGTPKLFADKGKRKPRVQRSEPLPGTKSTLPSADDGVLEQLFTAHDSTTIPKPVGGRKLMVGEEGVTKQTACGESTEGFRKLVLQQQAMVVQPSPYAKLLGLLTYLAGIMFWFSIGLAIGIHSDAGALMAILFFFGVHWCAIFSRVLSGGRCRHGKIGLACFWASLGVFFVIANLIP